MGNLAARLVPVLLLLGGLGPAAAMAADNHFINMSAKTWALALDDNLGGGQVVFNNGVKDTVLTDKGATLAMPAGSQFLVKVRGVKPSTKGSIQLLLKDGSTGTSGMRLELELRMNDSKTGFDRVVPKFYTNADHNASAELKVDSLLKPADQAIGDVTILANGFAAVKK